MQQSERRIRQDSIEHSFVFDQELLEEECSNANHAKPTHVDFDVVETLLIAANRAAQLQRVETKVARAAVLLVLHTEDVVVCLISLQVVLSQCLVAEPQGKYRSLQFVQAQGAIQVVDGAGRS